MAPMAIMALAGLFGLFYLFRLKSPFSRIVTAVLVGGTALSLVPFPAVKIDGYYIFALGEALALTYAFANQAYTAEYFPLRKKVMIAVIAILGLLPRLLLLALVPGFEWLGLTGAAVVVLYGYILARDLGSYRNEIGFLTILAADGLSRLIVTLMITA